MASGTADLQRDLGGAIMQSILGSVLAAGYTSAFSSKIAASPQAAQISDNVQGELTKSFAGAAGIAHQYPQYAGQIVSAAKSSFLQGDQWAYAAGLIAILIGALIVFFLFPRKAREQKLLHEYAEEGSA